LARRALNIATGVAQREPDLQKRTTLLTNLGRRAAWRGDFRRSALLARLTGNSVVTLDIYSLLLDRIVLARDPEIYRRWGFGDDTWPASGGGSADKRREVPPCGIDDPPRTK
jgi:hypothetical protein